METRHGAIILCGGQSRRMGTAKQFLPFGTTTMLARVVELVAQACDPVVIVTAGDQEIPTLSVPVTFCRDRRPDRGPLEGLAVGLAAMPEGVEAVFASGCDAPLLKPSFILRMFELLGDHAAAVPVGGGYLHPLSAVYRTSLLEVIEQLLAGDRLKPSQLFDVVATRRVDISELMEADPALDSLRNINTRQDYCSALRDAGFEPTDETLRSISMS